MCLSTSCIHLVSYVGSPIGLFTTSYVFVVSISELPLHQQLLACILSQYLHSPHPVPGQKKHVLVQKKKAPRSKNIQLNVSAYNNGVSPPHPMEARSTKQAHGSKKQKPRSEHINLAVLKKLPWVQHKYMQVQKNITTGSRKHTGTSPTFFCAPRSKKNPARSRKHVQVQNKGAQAQKNMHPIFDYTVLVTLGQLLACAVWNRTVVCTAPKRKQNIIKASFLIFLFFNFSPTA